ncbi:MAG: sigma 54-interacting transcriptional regulator [Polyangiaceae bacterium]|nr:sigma 54-interacting transcriptional regulator [Polyangiaceae bacterium]
MTSSTVDPRFEIAKLLLTQEDDVLAAEVLLRQMLDLTGADRGFVVARTGEQFEPRFAVRFNAVGDDEQGRFSRSLVRAALARNRSIHSTNPAEDPELSGLESLAAAAGRAVLVVPLSSGDERFGAMYLEHPKAGGFSSDAIRLVGDVAELGGLALYGAVQRTALARRTSALERDLFAQHDFTGIVTRDPAMMNLLRTVAQVADAKASVIITGESGTGKELIAKALHVNSDRRRGPFVALHCAALPSTMLESELFGHVKGAFTGADKDRAGRYASAKGGTLFLDEVAEISLETQAKLLRAIQFGEVQRLGTDKLESVDVRVVAATHANLAERVAQGTFRQDLYYRLRVVELKIPPLRERTGDIPLLAHHFLDEMKKRPGARFAPTTLRKLEAHNWPGNVRELAHAIERACLLTTGDEIGPEHLPEEIANLIDARPRAEPVAVRAPVVRFSKYDKDELEAVTAEVLADLEQEFVEGLLKSTGGNVSRAASVSGIHRSQLQRMIARQRK